VCNEFLVLIGDFGFSLAHKVSRIEAHSENYEMDLLLDINSEIYSIKQEEKFELALATSIQKDGTPDPSGFDQRGGATMLDDWEYVMHGKVFKIESDKSANLKVYVTKF
jgi:DNA-directed RNA polymerase I, II, and III subunit RPABC3